MSSARVLQILYDTIKWNGQILQILENVSKTARFDISLGTDCLIKLDQGLGRISKQI